MFGQRTTAKHFEALKPGPDGTAQLTDSEIPGLTLRAGKRGKVWTLLTRVDAKKVRLNIGAYGDKGPELNEWSLAEARDEARRLRALVARGIDPRQAEIDAKREAEAKRAALFTVADAIAQYAAVYLAHLRTGGERERQLRNALEPFSGKPIATLTRADLQRAIDDKAAAGATIAANRVRAALTHFSRWCWQRGHLPEHIGAGTTRAAREAPRDRVLSLDEVRSIFGATYALPPMWGAFYRVLLLTGQRRSDIRLMRWAEIDFAARRYAIPAARTKSGRAHIVHLSAPVLVELEALKSITGDTPFVFTSDRRRPVAGLYHYNAKLYDLSDLPDWRPHDFRTAFASELCERGESENVVDRVLNHAASGSAPSAVARVYNRSELLPQRAAALDRWAELVTGERAAVVRLAR